MFSEQGDKVSPVLYSLVETAKANGLRVYDYLEYALTQLVNHAEDTYREFLKDLLPWSEYAQAHFLNTK